MTSLLHLLFIALRWRDGSWCLDLRIGCLVGVRRACYWFLRHCKISRCCIIAVSSNCSFFIVIIASLWGLWEPHFIVITEQHFTECYSNILSHFRLPSVACNLLMPWYAASGCLSSVFISLHLNFFLSVHHTWRTHSCHHQHACGDMSSFMLKSFLQWLVNHGLLCFYSSQSLHSYFFLFLCMVVPVCPYYSRAISQLTFLWFHYTLFYEWLMSQKS